MNPEIAAYSESIRDRITLVYTAVEGLDERRLNWRPPFEGANSAAAIATHAMGNAHAWVLGIACGRSVGRDRPGEFATSADTAAELALRGRSLCGEIEAALHELPPARLEVRLVPSQELWGEGPAREISVRDALVQAVEHASLHLGHLHVTRDLALATL